MKKCIILSMDNPEGWEIYDHLLEAPLEAAGWQHETLSWKAPINWSDYQLVIIRSPWDYQLHAEEFIGVLQAIENSSAHLDNPLNVCQWNIDKKYLQDLAEKGVLILPTIWQQSITADSIPTYFAELDTSEIVVKPRVSAGAFDTYRLSSEKANLKSSELIEKFTQRDFMVQPFVENIVSEGEFSLFYFDDEYSHAILKTPKQNDFRVQEEFGGQLLNIKPEAELLAAADKVLGAIDSLFDGALLYARLDFVRTSAGFALMEAELIEPSLYFNLDPESPARFVEAVERRMQRLGLIS